MDAECCALRACAACWNGGSKRDLVLSSFSFTRRCCGVRVRGDWRRTCWFLKLYIHKFKDVPKVGFLLQKLFNAERQYWLVLRYLD